MTRPEIAAEIKEYLETEFPVQGLDLTETTNLLEEWFVDSLGIVETVNVH